MHSRILAALDHAPGGQVALCDEHRAISFTELREAVGVESDWLKARGVQRCALLADNGAGWAIADLALLQLRALNVPTPAWFTAPQIAHVLADAALDCILTDDPERVEREQPAFTRVGRTPHSQLALLRRARPQTHADVAAGVVKITYTSGSTGAAKGVCLTLQAIEQTARSIAYASPLGVTRHLCTTPLATLLENIAGVYAPLLMGGTCVAPSANVTGVRYGALDAQAFIGTISNTAPHSLILTPELLRVLIHAALRGWKPPPQLQFIAVGGAVVAPALLEDAATLGLPVYEGYGLSECASVVCLNTPADARRGSVGRPLPHARVRVDENGQIHVRGALMSGYLGDNAGAPEEIATGDLGWIDEDGYVYVRGRLKNLVITSMGRNVSPEWVEAQLTRDAAVAQAVVIGEARPWLAALVVPAARATAQQIERAVAAANARLPSYAQVRAWIDLPEPLSFSNGLLTANGRPRRDVIAARYAATIDALYETAKAS